MDSTGGVCLGYEPTATLIPRLEPLSTIVSRTKLQHLLVKRHAGLATQIAQLAGPTIQPVTWLSIRPIVVVRTTGETLCPSH